MAGQLTCLRDGSSLSGDVVPADVAAQPRSALASGQASGQASTVTIRSLTCAHRRVGVFQ